MDTTDRIHRIVDGPQYLMATFSGQPTLTHTHKHPHGQHTKLEKMTSKRDNDNDGNDGNDDDNNQRARSTNKNRLDGWCCKMLMLFVARQLFQRTLVECYMLSLCNECFTIYIIKYSMGYFIKRTKVFALGVICKLRCELFCPS